MSDCCSSTNDTKKPVNRHICPNCSLENKPVSTSTILQHILNPWEWEFEEQQYYFCDNPECDVVYFSQDNSVIRKPELRTQVGIKTKSKDALLCYCYGISYRQVEEIPKLKQFVIAKTKSQLCACEIRNPSGRCCLKDFPK